MLPTFIRRRPVRGFLLSLLCAAMIGSVGCKPAGLKPSKDPEATEVKKEKPFLTPVLAERVERGEIHAAVPTTGSVVPSRSRLLRSEESGRLRFDRPWQEGDFVAAGTRVARVESEALDGDITRAKSDVELQEEALAIAKKSMDSSTREYKTIQDLYSRGISALKDVDAAQLSMERAINSYRQNQISLDKARAALKLLEDRVERLDILAPYDGLLVARTTLDGTKPFSTTFGSEAITDFEGRLIGNEFAVCGIIDTKKVLLRCDVTSRDVARVRLEQDVIGTIYSSQDLAVSGRVVEIGRAASADSRAFQVDVLVENEDMVLKPGMFGRIDIITERRKDTISIDKSLITRRNNRDVIFVADRDAELEYQIAREVPVETGLEGRDEIEVTWGLKEGDALVVRGFEVLQDRTPVTVVFTDDPVVPAKPEEKQESREAAGTGEAQPAS